MSDDYDEAARKLLEAYRGTIGQAADGIAERSDNANMNDGELESFEGEEEELGDFIDNFKDIMGDVAYTLARQNLEDIKPENIQE